MHNENKKLTAICMALAVTFTGGATLGLWAAGKSAPEKGKGATQQADGGAKRVYENRLTPIANPAPLLADCPEFVQPVVEVRRFEAPPLLDEEGADLAVRAWRFSYNARGIIEIPNRIRADRTAVIMVHPWGIDDGQGWNTPDPAGVADFCTLEKNHLAGRHTREVVVPLIDRLRPQVKYVMYSLRSGEKPAHKKLYRSIRHNPSVQERAEGKRELQEVLGSFECGHVSGLTNGFWLPRLNVLIRVLGDGQAVSCDLFDRAPIRHIGRILPHVCPNS